MSHASNQSLFPDHNSGDSARGVSDGSMKILQPDLLVQPPSDFQSPFRPIKSSLTQVDIQKVVDTLNELRITLPKFEYVETNPTQKEKGGVSILLTVPRGVNGTPYFDPSYLRAANGRELYNSERETIALVTRSITREILKLSDLDDVEAGQPKLPAFSFSGKLRHFLTSVPYFDDSKREMICDATYIGFPHSSPIPHRSSPRMGDTLVPSLLVISALRELFIDSVCTLYSFPGPKPNKWANILSREGVTAVIEGMTSACNELNLMNYSSQICDFVSDEMVLVPLDGEFHRRWKQSHASVASY